MDLDASTVWWLLAGVVVAAELATGTFYLLMIAVGLVGAALAAHAGAPLSLQITSAALVGGGATALWHLRRLRHPRSAPSERNADMLMDIGQTVQVRHWNADGSALVQHRGSTWQARAAPQGFGAQQAPAPGAWRVASVQGNTLILEPLPDRPA